MNYRLLTWVCAVVFALPLAPPTYAQGGATSTLSGVVTDASGAVVPGADVTVKSDATGSTFSAVSGVDGAFTIPAIPPGTYTATVSLQGFKTAVLKDVIVNVGVPTSVKAVLEIGGREEEVVVTAASEVIQTQRTAVATTLTERQIMNIPIPGRGAFDLVSLLPGVTTSDGSIRSAQINGLPQSAVNITLDGMNIQDNYAKSWDGMFTRVSPRLDAVEEVTVATASQGSDMSGQGGVQVKFVTRSGTNQFTGSGYYYLRRDWMNSNTWFNLNRNVDAQGNPSAKPVVEQHQPGGRLGGPIIRNKAFFFVNYEESRTPGTNQATRTIMSPLSEQGIFAYGSGQQVNLLQLAAANGHISSIDPVVAGLIRDVRAATATTGTVSPGADPQLQSYVWQQSTKSVTKFPTVKLDYNITDSHRATFSITRNMLLSDPDTTNTRQAVFPGFPVHGLQDSLRHTSQASVRSTLTSNLVNEFRVGMTGGPTKFSPDLAPGMWNNSGLADMAGYNLSWSNYRNISNAASGPNYSAREGSTKVIENTLNWMRGRHQVSMGTSITRADVWQQNLQHVPNVTLGMATGDPAEAMFVDANFPNASNTDITNARNLYAILTGRVTSVGREARIGADGQRYNILGESMQEGRLWDVGVHIQDSWRWRPDFTINAGLRWNVQTPFAARNNSYSMATIADLFGVSGTGANFVPGELVTGLGNLFRPGVFEGQPTTYKLLEAGTKAYNTDWNNFAPSIGTAWTLGFDQGWKRTVFGQKGDSVLRTGYNIAYQRGGMSDFVEVFGSNPGISIDATRNQTNQNLGQLPLLLRSGDLSAPSIPLDREYPMSVPSLSSNVRVFDPDITVPWSSSFSVGFERKLARDMSASVTYVRTDSFGSWSLGNLDGLRNYNEVNIVENQFLNEFKSAMNNLQANIAAGRGNTFAYTGAAGTSPLPIFFAHATGGSANAGNATSYTGNFWTNTTLVNSLVALNPQPYTAAGNLRTNFRTNMLNAGLPSNFWVVNPEVTNAQMVANGGKTYFNGLQLSLNRRFAGGFQAQANYSLSDAYQDDFLGFRKPYQRVFQSQTRADLTAGSGIVRHVLAVNWVYELPFGNGRRFASNVNPWLHRIIGDWNFQGVARFQSGRVIDFGNVRMVGFNEKDLTDMFQLRRTTDPNNQYRTLLWMLPQDVIDNTIKAHSFNASGYTQGAPTGRYFMPANGADCIEIVTGYGDCGTGSLTATGPMVMRWDFNFVKQIPIVGRVRAEYQLQIFNVFNRANFNPVNYVGNVLDSYQTTGAVDQSRTGQMAFRITW